MKKIILFLLAIIILPSVALFSGCDLFGDKTQTGNNTIEKNDEIVLSDGEKTFSKEISKVASNGILTKEIINNILRVSGITTLKTVKIGEGIIYISEYTFENCSSLTSITLSDTIASIGYDAFKGCSALTSIFIPESVTYIDRYIFSGCSSLTSVIVDENNLFYDSRNNCNGIIETSSNTLIAGCKNTIIPNTVTKIKNAFAFCDSLTSITIPNSVTELTDGAFAHCASLTSITIPSSVTNIGQWAFQYCTSLTSIEIPNSVRGIGSQAFADCSSLISITIPNSVRSIGSYAFSGCSLLTTIIIPSSVEWLDSGSFSNCDLLTIYCEFSSQPRDWNYIWNISNRPAYWYSETQPTTTGNYWHYVNGVVTKW